MLRIFEKCIWCLCLLVATAEEVIPLQGLEGRVSVFAILILPLVGYVHFFGLFGELFFPSVVDLVRIEVGEDQAKDVRIPIGGMTFDAFFDILTRTERRYQRTLTPHTELKWRTHLWKLKPVGSVVGRENDGLRTGSSCCYRLLPQTTNAKNFAGDGQFARHGYSGIQGFVKCEG